MAQWRRSGRPASEFAEEIGVKATTLRWWFTALSRDTRAKHGSGHSTVVPIEIAIPRNEIASARRPIEIAVGASIVVRCETGSDVAYVASLVRAIAG